ncbi:glucose-6-phosphate 1-dehydrogenase [Cryobacterium sp. MP_M5]|uniref:glucose-6-phosphate dehydrogenase n=1 Tax=unclassified Cryobacterium TaxID=2649013 RepID=UPI0018CB03DA|nr:MULTISPECIES: glucose-6-phosphate dehydrogenase [unclassified Cryobacterium]MBG6059724.1 glucose-6-phosphate 1-dehydrogenase [Cryobacterium sp. MP_M3]MEC5178096.1 glucose-6-phosphate 1-dehydrogenase [Cryobacterium sp. MP_M5]
MTKPISTLLILGAGGDLAARLLLPALGQLLTAHPNRRIQLIGAGREEFSPAEWLARLTTSFALGEGTGAAVERILETTEYHTSDLADPAELERLIALCSGVPAIYFALPPAIAAGVCDALADVALPDGTQLALEKPFGVDEQGAIALNARLARLVPEDQIHRVDHFLGRSTVLNLVGLRFANRIFEPLWSNIHIERVDVVYDEQLGLEGRAGYYDRAGAMVDMIQSHLLQVLAVLAMEPPSSLDAADLRDAKGIVLRATRLRGGSPTRSSRRGRYTAGKVDGKNVPSYLDEKGVQPANDTETLAEVTFEIDNWRWAGVPFTLRSGKALGERRREIAITFKPVPHLPIGLSGLSGPTVLRIFLGPDEMAIDLNLNGPGDPHTLDRVRLGASFGPGQLLAYGEVLEGVLDGDPALSVRADTAVQCWRIVAPVLAAWRAGKVPLEDYPAGTDGPAGWKKLG